MRCSERQLVYTTTGRDIMKCIKRDGEVSSRSLGAQVEDIRDFKPK